MGLGGGVRGATQHNVLYWYVNPGHPGRLSRLVCPELFGTKVSTLFGISSLQPGRADFFSGSRQADLGEQTRNRSGMNLAASAAVFSTRDITLLLEA